MFCSVGGKGSFFWGCVGSWSLTLLCLELVSNSRRMLADGRYCIAISAWGDVVAAGFGKSLGSIPMSTQAALLKYSLWIFLHMYRACLVVLLEAYGSSTVGEDLHLSAAIPGGVPSLPGIWLWWEWDDVCLYLHYLACVLSRVCTRRLVKGDMSDECVHGCLISPRAFPNYLCHFLCPAYPW